MSKAPQANLLCGASVYAVQALTAYRMSGNGGGGTRTPKGLRPPHFECGALPVRLRLQNCRRSLVDPASPVATATTLASGAPRYRPKYSIGAPGFEPGTSATRTQRSTGLSHAPCSLNPLSAASRPPRSGRGGIRSALLRRSLPGSLPWGLAATSQRTGWDSNPRGLAPTRFPIVLLKPLGHLSIC